MLTFVYRLNHNHRKVTKDSRPRYAWTESIAPAGAEKDRFFPPEWNLLCDWKIKESVLCYCYAWAKPEKEILV